MQTKRVVQRYGSSLVISLPAETARRLGIREGDQVVVEDRDDEIAVHPARSLAELVADWKPLGSPGLGESLANAVREERDARAESL